MSNKQGQIQDLCKAIYKAFFFTLLVCAFGGCKKCDDPHDPFVHNEPTTTVRGVGGEETSFPAGIKVGESTRGYSGVLVQPLVLSGQEIEHRPFVMGYYIDSSLEIGSILFVLASAEESEPSTCKPDWRMDIFGTKGHKVVEINELCRRIRIEDRFFEYSPEIEKVIRPVLQRSVSRPTHRIVRLQAPVLYEPDRLKKLLRSSSVVAYLPGKDFGPLPRVKVSAIRRAPIPADYTQLDEAAAALRREVIGFLKQYAQGLLDTKAVVYGYEGPYPLEEEFGRDLRVRYGATIYFRTGTDALTMRYHSSFLNLRMDEVEVPDFFRMDVVFNIEMKYGEVLKTISNIAEKAVDDVVEGGKEARIPRIMVLRRSLR